MIGPLQLEIPLTIRDLDLGDLPDIEWSGGTSHLAHVAEQMLAAEDGTCRVLGVHLPNGTVIAKGGVRFAEIVDPAPPGVDVSDVGELWMLAVRESWQSVGVGTVLITALEQAIQERGRTHAMMGVELDNPRAHALYDRLGYSEYGHTLDGWPVGPRTHYVTVGRLMVKPLARAH